MLAWCLLDDMTIEIRAHCGYPKQATLAEVGKCSARPATLRHAGANTSKARQQALSMANLSELANNLPCLQFSKLTCFLSRTPGSVQSNPHFRIYRSYSRAKSPQLL